MKKSIVFKWFVLILLLFSMMFLIIGITQNYLFEKYYIRKKSDALIMYMNEYSDMAEKEGLETASAKLYQNNQIWVTKLDQYGRIYDVENYYIEVAIKGNPQASMKIPMYPFEGEFSSDVRSSLMVGDDVIIDTVNLADERIPYLIQTASRGVVNLNIANKLHGPHADEAYRHLETGIIRGRITRTVFPEEGEDITFPYREGFFFRAN